MNILKKLEWFPLKSVSANEREDGKFHLRQMIDIQSEADFC